MGAVSLAAVLGGPRKFSRPDVPGLSPSEHIAHCGRVRLPATRCRYAARVECISYLSQCRRALLPDLSNDRQHVGCVVVRRCTNGLQGHLARFSDQASSALQTPCAACRCRSGAHARPIQRRSCGTIGHRPATASPVSGYLALAPRRPCGPSHLPCTSLAFSSCANVPAICRIRPSCDRR
jgi:hypothetical protein